MTQPPDPSNHGAQGQPDQGPTPPQPNMGQPAPQPGYQRQQPYAQGQPQQPYAQQAPQGQQPYAQQPVQQPYAQPSGYGQQGYGQQGYGQAPVNPGSSSPSNTLGLISFICSLISLITCCGFFSPITLLMSFIALFKAPRGFAIFGLIISLVGTLLLGGVVAGFTFIGLKQAETDKAFYAADVQIQAFAKENKRLPSQDELVEIMGGEFKDGWGHNIVIRDYGDGDFELISPSIDGKLGTDDDDYFVGRATVSGDSKSDSKPKLINPSNLPTILPPQPE